ncbi:folate-binding protein YgfZ [Rhodococcus aerolatus]
MTTDTPAEPTTEITTGPTAPVSPLLGLPGAVPAPEDSPDAGVAWHLGDPFGEQRAATRTAVAVDRSHRAVLAVSGADRLSWLHSLTSQHLSTLGDGATTEDLLLDAQGRVEQHVVLTDLDGTTWLDLDADRAPALLTFLQRMVFWSAVEVRDATAELAVLSLLGPDTPAVLAALELTGGVDGAGGVAQPLPGGGFVRPVVAAAEAHRGADLLVPRDRLAAWWGRLVAAGARPAGTWAHEALRVAAVRPRIGLDTDERTIPHEVGWIGAAVHLDKGCYRGQETVARVHNLGSPPRRLVLLHLDGSADGRPATGDAVTAGGRSVGRVGTVVEHHEHGPVALALLKRSVPVDTALEAGPCAAAVDPDSVVTETGVQAGREAVARLRGR